MNPGPIRAARATAPGLMRAVVYDRVGGPLTVREVPVPRCPADGAVVRVAAAGLCRSDWHAWRGHDPVALPLIPGHEFAGTVIEVGPTVREWQPGARVTAPFVQGCGECEFCRSGAAQVCPHQVQPGFTAPGAFAELVVVEHADLNLVRLPRGVDFVAAAALGCRFATAFRALTVDGAVKPGHWVAVFGCGGVGLSAILIGRALGAAIIAVDISDAALQRARELGASAAVNPTTADVPSVIYEITEGGAQVTIDAIGSPAALSDAIRSLRRHGRHVQIGLLLGANATPAVPMDLVISRELSIHGSHGMAAVDYGPMLDLVEDGRLDPGLLVAEVMALTDVPSSFTAMDGPAARAGITVIRP